MAHTVKQVAAMSGVSVRTLHFYDETGLLEPAYIGANGYRFYEERQLLALQQILFYRELGFELKEIRRILGRPDFQRLDALRAHRESLEESLARTRRLLETIDRTIDHVEGGKPMTGEEMFAGFTVAAVAAMGLVYFTTREAPSGPLRAIEGRTGTQWVARERRTVQFDDGSSLVLAAGAQVDAVENDGHRFDAVLRRGRVFVQVRPNGPRRCR